MKIFLDGRPELERGLRCGSECVAILNLKQAEPSALAKGRRNRSKLWTNPAGLGNLVLNPGIKTKSTKMGVHSPHFYDKEDWKRDKF